MAREQRAPLVVRPGNGKVSLVFGETITHKVSSFDTGGRFAIFEAVVPLDFSSSALVHRSEDVIVHVLEGELAVLFADGKSFAPAGSTIVLPKGSAYAVRNVGWTLCRMLVTLVPGGFERFLEEIADMALNGAPEGAEMKELAGRYGLELLTELGAETRLEQG